MKFFYALVTAAILVGCQPRIAIDQRIRSVANSTDDEIAKVLEAHPVLSVSDRDRVAAMLQDDDENVRFVAILALTTSRFQLKDEEIVAYLDKFGKVMDDGALQIVRGGSQVGHEFTLEKALKSGVNVRVTAIREYLPAFKPLLSEKLRNLSKEQFDLILSELRLRSGYEAEVNYMLSIAR